MNKFKAELYPLIDGPKKWLFVIRWSNGKKQSIRFGDKNYEDYTMHKDKHRRYLYRIRHINDNLDRLSAGVLSWHILWGPHTSVKKNYEYFINNVLPNLRD